MTTPAWVARGSSVEDGPARVWHLRVAIAPAPISRPTVATACGRRFNDVAYGSSDPLDYHPRARLCSRCKAARDAGA